MKFDLSAIQNGEGMTYAPFKQLFIKTSTIEPNQDALVRSAFTSSMPSFIVHRSTNPDFEVSISCHSSETRNRN
jgi:hypothetical protein